MAKNVGFVCELGVRDVEVSIEFYQGIGCVLVETVSDDSGRPFWAEVSYSDSRLMLQRLDLLVEELPGVSTAVEGHQSALVLRVEPKRRALDVLAKLESSGVTLDSGPTETDYGTIEFSFRDPDGYVIVVAGRE